MSSTSSVIRTSSGSTSTQSPAVQRGLAAAKTMARNLDAEHKRWQMPLLTWKQGRVVKVSVSRR